MKNAARLLIWISIVSISLVLQVPSSFGLGIDNGDWPKEITIRGGRVVLYQLQPERLDGIILESRAAVSVEMDNAAEPVFGAVWLTSRLSTDRDDRIAVISETIIKDIRFPDKEKDDLQELKNLLEQEIPKWELEIDLDRLAATLDLAEKRDIAAQKINTSPPKILFVPRPAVLITIDGEPRLSNIENSSLMRVVNSPFTILFSLSENKYYLYADKGTWYISNDIMENWTVASNVPGAVAALTPIEENTEQSGIYFDSSNDVKPGPPPEIYVSTEPAELISSYGEPEYTPISRTNLLYISNTDSDVLMHIMERKYYVLLAGRWYRSASLNGHWEYVAGKDLPDDFSRIPEDSHMGTVLYAVPGTDVAREAVMDAYIPQTAAVDRNKASLTVEYDGKPEFDQIRGSSLYYALNSTVPVIWAGRWYYACDQAVWFVAPSPRGPWTVATSVPDAIYLIPPESPVYNVTFVRVYDVRPNVVYVGYTPGYTHTYVYYDTIVYGTGYYWPGWYGRYYYPRHRTWGYHPRWNPWSGWAFGLSYGAAPFDFYLGTGSWYRNGWWGPTYYRSYRHGYYHGYRRAKHAGYRAGYRTGYRDAGYRERVNIYRGKRNKVRVIDIPERPVKRFDEIYRGGGKKRPNNVYVDPQGNIYRRNDDGWQTRVNKKWLQQETVKPLQTRPAKGPLQIYRPGSGGKEQYLEKPARGSAPAGRSKKQIMDLYQSRPDTGPVRTYRPESGSREQFRSKPERGSAPAGRSKKQIMEQYQSRPDTGPVRTYRPDRDSMEYFGRKPSTKIVPSGRPEMGRSGNIRTRPSMSPVKAREPKTESVVRPLRVQPSKAPAQAQVPQKYKGQWRSPAQDDTDQLERSYNARQQGASRAQSFSGTVKPGRNPSSGLGGGRR